MHTGSYKRRFSSWSWKRYRPSQLRFTHDSIKTDFQDGNSMEETLRSLVNGTLNVENMQPMVVMRYRGRPYVVRGNRRLYLYQKLEKHGHLDAVTVREVEFDEDIFEKMHTTTTEGIGVRLRGYYGYRMDEDLDSIIRRHSSRFIAASTARYRVVPPSVRQESFTWEELAGPASTPLKPIYPSAGSYVESETTCSDVCRAIVKLLVCLFVLLVVASLFMKKG